MIHLTTIGLTPGGSSTVHIYRQTIHRTTESTQTIHRITESTQPIHRITESTQTIHRTTHNVVMFFYILNKYGLLP
jgi:hypothetical protein